MLSGAHKQRSLVLQPDEKCEIHTGFWKNKTKQKKLKMFGVKVFMPQNSHLLFQLLR